MTGGCGEGGSELTENGRLQAKENSCSSSFVNLCRTRKAKSKTKISLGTKLDRTSK